MDQKKLPTLLLYCKEFSSDKLYYVSIRQMYLVAGEKTWGIYIMYGRFPTLPNSGWRCEQSSLEFCLKEYAKLVAEKLNKGYIPIEHSLNAYEQTAEPLKQNNFSHLPTYHECIRMLRATFESVK